MRYCSVKGCKNNDNSNNVRFHNVRESWKTLNCWKNSPYQICSVHFKPSSYSASNKLKKTAFPTLFIILSAPEIFAQIFSEHNYSSPGTQVLKRR